MTPNVRVADVSIASIECDMTDRQAAACCAASLTGVHQGQFIREREGGVWTGALKLIFEKK